MNGRACALATLFVALLCAPAQPQAEWPDPEIRRSPEFDARDRDGLRRDTWYYLGYQWVTIGLLYVAPESVSGWTDEQKENYSMSIWWDNVTHPQWDSDDFYLNYVVHPYWGAAYYVRARERGCNDRQAFWYSVKLSSMYEFGAEALFEEVSIQDVFVTPIAGALLGRYFMRVRDNIRDRELQFGHLSGRDRWIWTLTDPLGALNRQVDKLTKRRASLQIRPYRYAPERASHSPFVGNSLDPEPVYGIEIHIQW